MSQYDIGLTVSVNILLVCEDNRGALSSERKWEELYLETYYLPNKIKTTKKHQGFLINRFCLERVTMSGVVKCLYLL